MSNGIRISHRNVTARVARSECVHGRLRVSLSSQRLPDASTSRGLQPANRRDDESGEREGSIRERITTVERLCSTLASRFDAEETPYVDASSRYEYELAQRHRRLLEQAVDLAKIDRDAGRGPRYGQQRDEYMAENVEWILRTEDTESIAIWAANGHIRKGSDQDDTGPLRYHLHESFGEEYCALALEFGAGTVRTADPSGAPSYPAQSVASPPEGTLHATLLDECDSPVYLDLQRATMDDTLRSWLSDRRVRVIGPGYDPDTETGFERELRYDFARNFDGLLFVPEVSAAELLAPVTDPNEK